MRNNYLHHRNLSCIIKFSTIVSLSTLLYVAIVIDIFPSSVAYVLRRAIPLPQWRTRSTTTAQHGRVILPHCTPRADSAAHLYKTLAATIGRRAAIMYQIEGRRWLAYAGQ